MTRHYRDYPGNATPTQGEFPRYRQHSEASCFHCWGDFGPDGYPYKSGYADGRGAFLQWCSKCGFATWYDVESGQ